MRKVRYGYGWDRQGGGSSGVSKEKKRDEEGMRLGYGRQADGSSGVQRGGEAR